MGEVIRFRGQTKVDLDPDVVLEETKGILSNFVILGHDKEGKLWFSSTIADGGDVLWMMEKLKHLLMEYDN